MVKSDEEWRKQLSPDSFAVTRHEGTERPYSGKYNDNHADGLYRCICCDTALFDSKTKFESGTGWPSFWKPISSANVSEIVDNSLMMERTAVACRRCDAHLGHVFDDGPDPTGLRYCMNSVSLNFVAAGLRLELAGQRIRQVDAAVGAAAFLAATRENRHVLPPVDLVGDGRGIGGVGQRRFPE